MLFQGGGGAGAVWTPVPTSGSTPEGPTVPYFNISVMLRGKKMEHKDEEIRPAHTTR